MPESALRRLPLIGRVARWNKRPRYPSRYGEPYLLRRTHPPVFGLAMYQQLHDSRVALNTHIDISAHSAFKEVAGSILIAWGYETDDDW
jgi:hypothetical protein